MIDVKKLSITTYKEQRELVKNLTFTLHQHDKYAIIGLEGVGKSTLLKALYDPSLIPYVEVTGHMHTKTNRIGYLPQMIDVAWDDSTTIAYLFRDQPSNNISPEAYQLFGQLDKILDQVQLSKDCFHEEKTLIEYSGGERIKLALAKALLHEPDVLLLDEPTNNLDLDTILFLEEFIQYETRPILYISHDETLLTNTANGIIHLTQSHKHQKAHTFFEAMSYEEYKQSRQLALDSQEMIARKQRSTFKAKMERYRQIYQQVKHQQDQAVRNPSKARLLAKKMKSLKSTEARYKKAEEQFLDIPEREEEIDLFFSKQVMIPNNKRVIDLTLDKLVVEGTVLSRDIELLIKGPSKIAIIGKNGSGKTTLLKEIYSILNQSDFTVGYMAQEYNEQLSSKNTALDFVMTNQPLSKEGEIRKMMGALHFTTEEMLYPQTSLSGGQQAKLLLLKMVLDEANVLLLDEPTRNLSPLSIPTIHTMLRHYQGCIIAITHDRTFLENVFDDIYILQEDGLSTF